MGILEILGFGELNIVREITGGHHSRNLGAVIGALADDLNIEAVGFPQVVDIGVIVYVIAFGIDVDLAQKDKINGTVGFWGGRRFGGGVPGRGGGRRRR